MNNSEKVQAALAAIRKRWMETHGGRTPQECRAALLTASHDSDDDTEEMRQVAAR